MELECSCTRTKTPIGPKTWRPLLMILTIEIVQDLPQTGVQSLQNIEDSLLEPSSFKPDAFRRESNEKQPKSKVKKHTNNQPCVVAFTFEPSCRQSANNQPITHVDIPKSSLPCFLALFPAHTHGKQSRKQPRTSCPAIKK